MNKHYPNWIKSTPPILLLCAALAGCASPGQRVMPLPQASKAQVPADLMKPAPPPSSYLKRLSDAFSN